MAADNCKGHPISKQVCRVLYVFSGKPRKNSIKFWLRKLSKQFQVAIEVEMIDIQVPPHHDLTKESVQKHLSNKIASGRYYAVLLNPPCSTFTRVVWANRRGPRPVRSFTCPRGFTRMTWAERKRARWGNTMADFTFEAFQTQAIDCGGLAFFENPEDLGALKSGEHRGIRPASMWQWEEFERLLEHEGIETVAFYKQDFGTQYLKPTRLLLGISWNNMWHFAMAVPPLMTKAFTKDHFSQEQHKLSWLGHQVLVLLRMARNSGHLICANG